MFIPNILRGHVDFSHAITNRRQRYSKNSETFTLPTPSTLATSIEG